MAQHSFDTISWIHGAIQSTQAMEKKIFSQIEVHYSANLSKTHKTNEKAAAVLCSVIKACKEVTSA